MSLKRYIAYKLQRRLKNSFMVSGHKHVENLGHRDRLIVIFPWGRRMACQQRL